MDSVPSKTNTAQADDDEQLSTAQRGQPLTAVIVAGFLRSLGLEKYLDIFEHEEIDMDVLVEMGTEELEGIGITADDDRGKILEGVKEFLPTRVVSVAGFLGSLGLEKYLDIFEREEIDMDVLVEMDTEELEGIGITADDDRDKILEGVKEILAAGGQMDERWDTAVLNDEHIEIVNELAKAAALGDEELDYFMRGLSKVLKKFNLDKLVHELDSIMNIIVKTSDGQEILLFLNLTPLSDNYVGRGHWTHGGSVATVTLYAEDMKQLLSGKYIQLYKDGRLNFQILESVKLWRMEPYAKEALRIFNTRHTRKK